MHKGNENKTISNFSTDDFFHWIFLYSLEQLEISIGDLSEESKKQLAKYINLSDKERHDFYKIIHSIEISTLLIAQEIETKKKFLKDSMNYLEKYNEISSNFYFKKTFKFFINIMWSKIFEIEISLRKIEYNINLTKENYSMFIAESISKQNKKINKITIILTIYSIIHGYLQLFPSMFAQNIRIPFQDVVTLWPFMLVLFLIVIISLVQLMMFKAIRWI